MNGSSVFLDTNIVLYLLAGDETIAELLDGKTIFVSFVTELELLGYRALDSHRREKITNLLSESIIVDINSEIKKTVIEIRQNYNIKLPDAIIAATSHHLNIPLMTSDKSLAKLSEYNILLYEK